MLELLVAGDPGEGVAIVLRGELAGRACRRRRDLAGEVVALLVGRPGLSAKAVARELRARPAEVLRVLREDGRFVDLAAGAARRGSAGRWSVADGRFRRDGNRFSGVPGVRAATGLAGGGNGRSAARSVRVV